MRVGFRTYDVEKWGHSIPHHVEHSVVGEHNGTANTIKIVVSQPPREIANTVIHELLHAVCDVYGIDLGDKEEPVVNTMANGITDIFRANPEFAAWFSTTLERD